MPLPKPRKGEEREAFMSRCHSALSSEFPDSDQRNAVCVRQWSSKKLQTHEASMNPLARMIVPFDLKAVAAADQDTPHTFEGLAAVWDLDLGNDVIHKGAFKNTLEMWRNSADPLPLLNSHNHFDIMSAVGQLVEARETKEGLWTRWELIPGPEGDAIFRRLQKSKLAKRPFVNKMSIGFNPVKFEFEQPEGTESFFDRVRHLKEVNLAEVSLVLFPMAPGAAIDTSTVKSWAVAIKSLDPKALTPESKLAFRQLAARIGNLLQKHSGGDGPDSPPAGPSDPPAGPGDTEEEEATATESTDPPTPALTPSTDTATEDTDTDTESDSKSPVPEATATAPTEVPVAEYQYPDALKQRIQKTLLGHRISSVIRSK